MIRSQQLLWSALFAFACLIPAAEWTYAGQSAESEVCATLFQGAESWANSPDAYRRIEVPMPTFRRPGHVSTYDKYVSASGHSLIGKAEWALHSYGGRLVELETEILNPDSTSAGRVLRGVETAEDGSTTVHFASASVQSTPIVTADGDRYSAADLATLRQFKAAGVSKGTVRKAFANQITNRRTQLELLLGMPEGLPANADASRTQELETVFDRIILKTHTSRYIRRILELTGNTVSEARIHLRSSVPGELDHDSLLKIIGENRRYPMDSRTQDLLRQAIERFCPDSNCAEIHLPSFFQIEYTVVPKAS